MDFATGALGPLLLKLGHLLQDEYNLQVGVKKDIEFVTRELESMHAALRDVGEVPQEQLSNIVKIWAQDVRELSYEMEDIVDTFLVCVQGSKRPSRRSAKRFIKKMTSSITEFTTRREIGQEIKNIKERVKEMAERRDRSGNSIHLHTAAQLDFIHENKVVLLCSFLLPCFFFLSRTGTMSILLVLKQPCWTHA